MKTNIIIEIEVSKQPLLTDKETGKQKTRLTLEEARELYAELPRLLNLVEKQPVPQAPQQPYLPGQVARAMAGDTTRSSRAESSSSIHTGAEDSAKACCS